jgi:DNA-binding XRE family transcriptional regulator
VNLTELKRYEIKEIIITYNMAISNPKYEGNRDVIIKKLAEEYNIPYQKIYSIIFGNKMHGKIGTNLRILRMTRNLTQQKVAEALGLRLKTIGYWENNKSFPNDNNLENLAEFYGVPVEELIEEEFKAPHYYVVTPVK